MQPYRPALRATVAAIALALAGTAMADEAKVIAERGELQIGNTAPAYSLRIAYPDGRTLEREVLAGETLSLDPAGPGDALVDGLYTYEARPIVGIAQRTDAQPHSTSQAEKLKPTSVESGTFRVQGNQILAATKQPEAPASDDSDYGVRMKDQVIADDLIVNGGSLCVGMDCVNGENFGADTIRLKENNLRIHFDDTSNSGSFPNVDWRLIANDQNNGGANYFAIEDSSAGRRIVEIRNAAPANSLFIDSSGRVGLKTNTPVVELHIADGDSPALRLEQNGSSGFASQTWDVAGNETNFFVRDVTNGSRIPFKIKPGAPTDSLFVASSGNVGLGITNPTAKLEVGGNTTLREGTLNIDKEFQSAIVFQQNGVRTATAFVDSGFNRLAFGRYDGAGNFLERAFLMDFAPSGDFTFFGPLKVMSDHILIASSRTPASSSAPCTAGEVSWDQNFVYVCVAANQWKRTALSSW